MKLLILFAAGAILAIVTAVFFHSNGVALLGFLMMLPAMARGVTKDLVVTIHTRTSRKRNNS